VVAVVEQPAVAVTGDAEVQVDRTSRVTAKAFRPSRGRTSSIHRLLAPVATTITFAR
jgi:hypothetical protein